MVEMYLEFHLMCFVYVIILAPDSHQDNTNHHLQNSHAIRLICLLINHCLFWRIYWNYQMKIKNGVNFTKISHSSHPRDYTFKEVKKKKN